MLQILALLLISWLLIWLFEKENLSVLGLTPTRQRIKWSALLFVITAICCAIGFLLRIYFAKEEYMVNSSLTASNIFSRTWEILRGVLTEELICRGALLYILIKKIGSRWAIVISSIIFGLLHWLNSGVFGNPGQMAIVFAFTFTMGLVFAYGYYKSGSLLIPIAIHFAWNVTEQFIFPGAPNNNSVFVLASSPPIVTISYFTYFLIFLLPLISAIVFNFLILRRITYRDQALK